MIFSLFFNLLFFCFEYLIVKQIYPAKINNDKSKIIVIITTFRFYQIIDFICLFKFVNINDFNLIF